MTPRWINRALDAAQRGDLDGTEEAVRDHFTVDGIFLLLKTAARRYGMSDGEMADELADYLERYEARQTRH